MEKELKPEESLKIINDMISSAKTDFKENSFYFIFWGWIIILANSAHVLIERFTSYPRPYYAWFIIIPGAIISAVYGFKHGKKQRTFTHIAKINMLTWFSFFIGYIILIFSSNIGSSVPVIFILAGNATFLTGIIIKFRPLVFGGIVFWLGAIGLFHLTGLSFHIVSIIVLILGYLIPGYILKYQGANA